MTKIITDQDALRQVSTSVEINPDGTLSPQIEFVINDLISTLGDHGLGLAAPQIGVFERIFLARLSCGLCVFINPSLQKSVSTSANIEGCLSLPDIQRTVSRSTSVVVQGDVWKITDGAISNKMDDNELKFVGMDAVVIQHEYDHLEGILMIDHPEVSTKEQQILDRDINRRARIQANRQLRAIQKQDAADQGVVQMNPKKAAKLKKQLKSARKRRQRRVEIEEYQKAINSGTIKAPANND